MIWRERDLLLDCLQSNSGGHGPFEQLLFRLCPSAWVSDRPVPCFDWSMSNCWAMLMRLPQINYSQRLYSLNPWKEWEYIHKWLKNFSQVSQHFMRRWVSLFLSFPISLLTHAIFNLWPLLAHSKVRGKLNVVLYPFNGTFLAIQRASISVRIIPQKNYVLKHFGFFVSLWGLRKYG